MDNSVECSTVAFIDIAGFSAITDVYGDSAALNMLDRFEKLVCSVLENHAPPIKWIGDEVMLSFPEPRAAILVIGKILVACREDSHLPLMRAAANHGPVIRKSSDLFGSTVNITARITALAQPGQLLATETVAKAASAEGISVRYLGETSLRSLSNKISIYEVQLAPISDPAWIDPVCKMHAPFSTYKRAAPDEPWFCSDLCRGAYYRSPHTYAPASS